MHGGSLFSASILCSVYPCGFGNVVVNRIGWFPINLCFNPCAIFNNFDANKGDLVVVGKFNRERKTGVKTVKGSKKIGWRFSARYSG